MDITISGYDGENVIAQIIEDLLTVNGLSVKRDDVSPINGNLNIEQLDLQLNLLRRNKAIINIKVLREDRPKYLPKKMIKSKISLPDFNDLVTRTTARLNEIQAVRAENLDLAFDDVFAEMQAPIPVAPVPAAPRNQNGDVLLFGGAVGAIQQELDRQAAPAINPQEVADEMPIIPPVAGNLIYGNV